MGGVAEQDEAQRRGHREGDDRRGEDREPVGERRGRKNDPDRALEEEDGISTASSMSVEYTITPRTSSDASRTIRAVDTPGLLEPVLAQSADDVLHVDDGVVDHRAERDDEARPGSSR